jgi:hypothetical protein
MQKSQVGSQTGRRVRWAVRQVEESGGQSDWQKSQVGSQTGRRVRWAVRRVLAPCRRTREHWLGNQAGSQTCCVRRECRLADE